MYKNAVNNKKYKFSSLFCEMIMINLIGKKVIIFNENCGHKSIVWKVIFIPLPS